MRRASWCVYCGLPLRFITLIACRAHRPLLKLDPYFFDWWRL